MTFDTSQYIIYYDIHEDKGGTRGLRLEKFVDSQNNLNYIILPKRLDYGDYQVVDKETGEILLGFEYKTIKDFYSSLMDNQRVINQCLDCKNYYGTSFLIIEGDPLTFVLENKYIHEKDMLLRQIYGAINDIDLNHSKVRIFPTEQLAFWNICNLIKKSLDGKDRNYHHVSIADNDYDFARNSLMMIRGIKEEKSRMIMDGLKAEHITDIINASFDDLKNIPNIGEEIASKVVEKYHKGELVCECS